MIVTTDRIRLSILRALAAASCVTCSMAAYALGDHAREFNISAQDLGDAVKALGAAADEQVLFSPHVVAGLRSRELRGAYTVEQALAILLEGTGLYLDRTTTGVFLIRSAKSSMSHLSARSGGQSAAWQQISTVTDVGPSSRLLVAQNAEPAAPVTSPGGSDTAQNAAATVEEVVVTGSQIRGARVDALPVSVVSTEQILSAGAVSGEDLYRSLPQAGDVGFNTQTLRGGSAGAARGDVSSINLRGLGSGNTLVLLNGRRIVQHPTSQGTQEVTYNANTIPVGALERLEVLRDGAAALYGSDAVAGVVNNVLQSDFEGLKLDAQFGAAESTSLEQLQVNALWGVPFRGGAGNITTFFGYTQDSALRARGQEYTESDDRRALLAGTGFDDHVAFDTRSPQSVWAGLQTLPGTPIVTRNGVALTSPSGQFHIQPASNAGCRAALPGGVCIDDGSVTGAADRNLRYDPPQALDDFTVTPSIKRFNAFSFINYDINDAVSFFGELGYYRSRTETTTFPLAPLAATPITIPAYNYYNPFGPITSPNRLPGLNIPDEGIPLTLLNYMVADGGSRNVQVDGEQYRVLAGLKGERWGWDWESAALYSGATSEDVGDGISSTLFQRALARSTPDAYNPFSGGDVTNPSLGDPTPSQDTTSFLIKNVRATKATLALWDFKLSRRGLLQLPAGPLGTALGIEVRRETSEDNRDRYGDLSTPFIDMVTGQYHESDALGASQALDVEGSRTVMSAYAELAVPIISGEMAIPAVRTLDLQVAGRFEDYSDVGSVAKPKFALFWEVLDGVRLRTSWSEGFKAPTLEQMVPVVRTTAQERRDDILCEADLRAGRIASFADCAQRPRVQRRVLGSRDLVPEESESFSYGLVLQATFLPPEHDLTVTIDRWKIEQFNRVSTVTAENDLTLDYLLRAQGSSNPAVLRATPTADDIAFVAGTGLAPIGAVLAVQTAYGNLDPRTIEGMDFSVSYRLDGTRFGDFGLNLNASRTLEYFQSPSALQRRLLEAQSAGIINAAVDIGGAADLLEDAGTPKWKGSVLLNWSLDNWAAGVSANYVGRVFQHNVRNAQGESWEVEALTTFNLYGEYRFTEGFAANTAVRLGARNITDEDPPLAINGYLGNLYQPYARYWYANISKTF
jgi:iron complex outermembrane recepter protein